MPAGRVAARPPVSALRRSPRSRRRASASSGDVSVLGYIAALAEQGPTRGPQNVFVNRRIVQGPDDRARHHRRLQRGVDQGAQPRGASVHRDAARRGGRQRAPDEGRSALPRPVVHPPGACGVPSATRSAAARRRSSSSTAPPRLERRSRRRCRCRRVSDDVPEPLDAGRRPAYRGAALELPERRASALYAAARGRRRDRDGRACEAAPASAGTLMPLGQFRDTFIIAVDEEGIAIIDQHVAHERVLFERITERLTSGRLESQRLLEPMLVELSAERPAGAAGARRGPRASGVRGRGVRRRRAARLGVPGAAAAARSASRRCARWPRTWRGSTAARRWPTRSSASPRRWRATRR